MDNWECEKFFLDPPEYVKPQLFPIRRQVFVQEILDFRNVTVVRTVAQEQFLGSNRPSLKDLKLECKEVPMEVDSSPPSSSIKQRLVNKSSDFEPGPNSNIKQRLVSKSSDFEPVEIQTVLVPLREPSASKFFHVLLGLIVILTLAGLYTISTTSKRYVYINRNFQLEKLKSDLDTEILQQKAAVKIVSDSLENIGTWASPVKVLPFIGGPGVGKTFTANVIKKNFMPNLVHEIQQVFLHSKQRQRMLLENLDPCCCNLLIIDDLRPSSTKAVIDFIKRIPKSQLVLVLPIFTTKFDEFFSETEADEADIEIMNDEFEASGLYYQLIFFESIEMSAAIEWLKSQLHKRGIEPSRHDSYINFFLNGNNIKSRGFKGLSSKLSLVLDGKRIKTKD